MIVPRICLITGGNSGIGSSAAMQIAGAGHEVIIGCRNKERAEQAVVSQFTNAPIKPPHDSNS